MKTAKDILIIGGGVIGLAIAVELQRQGANVTRCQQRLDAGGIASSSRNVGTDGRKAK